MPVAVTPTSDSHWQCPHCQHTVVVEAGAAPPTLRCPACQVELSDAGAPTSDFDQETQDFTGKPGAMAAPEIPGFEILSVLGQGGMGVVYKARDLSLPRQVAIKTIRTLKTDRSKPLARFRKEADAIARLQHPNVVQIFAVGSSPTGPYFVLELVEGGTLAQKIQGTPQDPRQAAQLVATLAHAMHAAHRLGIVHRDLKPGNILLQIEMVECTLTNLQSSIFNLAVPKITDFGLVKSLDDDESQAQTQGVVGTPSYMAPEQATEHHRDVGPSADVYALGAILYELLTGRAPFKGPTVLETLDQVKNQEPVPPARLQPKTPRDLETICLKCLEKDPRKRYTSAQALAEDLGRFLDGQPILARPIGKVESAWKWARRRPAAAGLIAVSLLSLLILGAALALDYAKNQEFVERLQGKIREVDEARKGALFQEGVARQNAKESEKRRIEAEKNKLLEVAARKEAVERSVRMTVGTGQRLQADDDYSTALLYFAEAASLDDPDGPQALKHQLRLAATHNQCPRLLQLWFHDKAVTQVAFSPKDELLLSASQDGTARVWDAKTGDPVGDEVIRHTGPINDAAFRLDGKQIATAGEDHIARVWEARTGLPVSEPLLHRQAVLHVAFNPKPDGPLLTVSGRRYAASVITSGKIPTTVNPFGHAYVWEDLRDAKRIKFQRHIGWTNYAEFSRDGQAVVMANCSMDKTNSLQVWKWQEGEKREGQIKHPFHVLHASFSPDGQKAVSAGGPHEGRTGEARIYDLATQTLIGAPMKHQGQVIQAWFSPDGQRILTASLDATARVWSATTGEPLTLPLRHNDRLTGAWFSPDGRVVLSAGKDGAVRLWDASTGEAAGSLLKHPSPVTCAAFSRRQHLVLTGCQDGSVRLWDLATPLYGPPIIKLNKFMPVENLGTYLANSGTKTVRSVRFLDGRIATAATYSPDGQHLLVAGGARFVDTLPGGGQAQSISGFRTTRLAVCDAKAGAVEFPGVPHPMQLNAPWLGGHGLFAYLDRDGEQPKSKPAVRVLEVAGGRALAQYILLPGEQTKTVALLADRTMLIAIQKDVPKTKGVSELWVKNIKTGQAVAGPLQIEGHIEDVVVSQNGAKLACLIHRSETGNPVGHGLVKTWDLGKPDSPVTFTTDKPVRMLALSPTGDRLAAWNPNNFHSVAEIGPAMDALRAHESDVLLWNMGSDQPLRLRRKGAILHAGFSPDGTQLVTASADHTARVWSAATGAPLTTALQHRGPVYHAEIHKDGLVVTASGDHSACVWDAATGEMIGPPLRHRDWVVHASFRPDGRQVATASCDGTVRLWDLAIPRRSAEQWKDTLQLGAAHLLDSKQGLMPLERAATADLWKKMRAQEPSLFQSSPAWAGNWRRGLLEQAQQEADWTGALVHLNLLLEEHPAGLALWVDRGRACAELGQWHEAEASFVKAKGLGEDTLPLVYRLCLLQCRLDKKNDYRQSAERLLQLLGRPDDVLLTSAAIRACLSAPDTLPVYDKLIKRIEELTPPKAKTPNATLLGAAHFRAGRLDEAAKLLAQAKSTGAESAWTHLFRALLHQKQDKPADARQALTAAIELIEGNPTGTPPRRALTLPWTMRLELQLLREEVEAALARGKASP